MMIKKAVPLEHDEQVAFVNWFRIKFSSVRILAIPNGTRTSIRSAIKAKKEGVSSGVPDLYVPAWKLWIEMKRQKGGRLSPEQKDWNDYLVSIGDQVIVANGCMDAVNQVLALHSPR
jgi:hypothetical protein